MTSSPDRSSAVDPPDSSNASQDPSKASSSCVPRQNTHLSPQFPWSQWEQTLYQVNAAYGMYANMSPWQKEALEAKANNLSRQYHESLESMWRKSSVFDARTLDEEQTRIFRAYNYFPTPTREKSKQMDPNSDFYPVYAPHSNRVMSCKCWEDIEAAKLKDTVPRSDDALWEKYFNIV